MNKMENTTECVKNAENDSNMSNEVETEYAYETKESLNMYLGLHFPTSGVGDGTGTDPILNHSGLPNHALRFPQRVAKLLVSLKPEHTNGRALDIGCAVGGSSFELAKTFDTVEAFDFRCVLVP